MTDGSEKTVTLGNGKRCPGSSQRRTGVRRVFAYLHLLYIAGVSITLALSVYHGSFRDFFVYPMCWACHTIVSIALVLVGIAVTIGMFLKPSIVYRLLLLWWIPQLISADLWHFSPDKSQAVSQALWHIPSGIVYSLRLGWEVGPDELLFVKFNVIAVVGIIVTVLTSPPRQSPAEATRVCGAATTDLGGGSGGIEICSPIRLRPVEQVRSCCMQTETVPLLPQSHRCPSLGNMV